MHLSYFFFLWRNAVGIPTEQILATIRLRNILQSIDPKIKAAISRLVVIPLVYVEQVPSKKNPLGFANAYRIVGLNPYKHMGTMGRGMDAYDYDEA